MVKVNKGKKATGSSATTKSTPRHAGGGKPLGNLNASSKATQKPTTKKRATGKGSKTKTGSSTTGTSSKASAKPAGASGKASTKTPRASATTVANADDEAGGAPKKKTRVGGDITQWCRATTDPDRKRDKEEIEDAAAAAASFTPGIQTAPPDSWVAGARIEAKVVERGKAPSVAFFGAEITKRHDNGTFDVKYDDGAVGKRLRMEVMRNPSARATGRLGSELSNADISQDERDQRHVLTKIGKEFEDVPYVPGHCHFNAVARCVSELTLENDFFGLKSTTTTTTTTKTTQPAVTATSIRRRIAELQRNVHYHQCLTHLVRRDHLVGNFADVTPREKTIRSNSPAPGGGKEEGADSDAEEDYLSGRARMHETEVADECRTSTADLWKWGNSSDTAAMNGVV